MWLFEDRLTVQYQVQEMLRTERIFEAEGIAEELAAYNPLIPDGRNWKVTFLIEYPDPEVRRVQLEKLRGVEDRCWVQVAGLRARVRHRRRRPGARERGQDLGGALPALRAERRDGRELKGGAALAVGIDHPDYQHEISPVAGQRARRAGRRPGLSDRDARSALDGFVGSRLFLVPLNRGVHQVRDADGSRNQAEQRGFVGADHVDGEVQHDADQHQHDAAAQRLGGRGGRRTVAVADQVRRAGRQLEAFFDGVHALAVILLEQLRLALVLGPDGQHADADAHDDGDDGDEDADNFRIHINFSE